MCIYIYIYTSIYLSIYLSISLSLYICMYVYIYIYNALKLNIKSVGQSWVRSWFCLLEPWFGHLIEGFEPGAGTGLGSGRLCDHGVVQMLGIHVA